MKHEDERISFEWFSARVQFFAFVAIIIVNLCWSYFGIYKQMELNSYRITQIENDRVKRWDAQTNATEKQIDCINDIKLTLAAIQTDITYIKNNKYN